MENNKELLFEELEVQEDLFWEYVGCGVGGAALGVIIYIGVAT